MRLIDADSLIRRFSNSKSGKTLKTMVDTQLTAYDVDKVVEELENKLSEKKYQHDGEDYYVGICDAIEIVKQGVR